MLSVFAEGGADMCGASATTIFMCVVHQHILCPPVLVSIIKLVYVFLPQNQRTGDPK